MLTDFQTFFTSAKRLKFSAEADVTIFHQTVNMLLDYLAKLKLPNSLKIANEYI